MNNQAGVDLFKAVYLTWTDSSLIAYGFQVGNTREPQVEATPRGCGLSLPDRMFSVHGRIVRHNGRLTGVFFRVWSVEIIIWGL